MTDPVPGMDSDRLGPAKLQRREAAQEMEALAAEIDRHDRLYYVDDAPAISDYEYDRLFRRLQAIEAAHPDIARSDSPTQRVGAAPRDELPTVEHAAPMLSLDSSYELGDVRRFDDRLRKALEGREVRYVLEPKLDGAALELVYEDGLLVRAVTRGDGRTGEGVTENARTIRSVPLRLHEDQRPVPGFLSVRCEALIYASDFKSLNKRRVAGGEDPYQNPRNTASGALRQLDSRIAADRPLTVLAYDILQIEDRSTPAFESDFDRVAALREWGFQVPEKVTRVSSVDEIKEYHRRFGDARSRLDYEIDGVVVKLDDLAARPLLGSTAHHPRWAIAFKFPPLQTVTRVDRIIVSVGRTGVLTPVALLRPIEVGGVTVTRASLHNREEVERKDVRVGDDVRLQRAGDVIPQIVAREVAESREDDPPRSAAFQTPESCPSCGARPVERGPIVVCPNRFACPAQLEGRIVHFASRRALDIEGLGQKNAALLARTGLVRELADLFDLEPEQLVQLKERFPEESPRFAELSARKLVEAVRGPRVFDLPASWPAAPLHQRAKATIRGRKRVELARFLVGLGIPEVGTTVARDLAAHFREFAAVRAATLEQLVEVRGIGEKMASAIREFLDDPRVAKALDHLLSKGFAFDVPAEPSPTTVTDPDPANSVAGKTFVITGSFESIRRSDLKERLLERGARVASRVGPKTDYLVAGRKPGSKLAKAKELDQVTVLDLDELFALLEPADPTPPSSAAAE